MADDKHPAKAKVFLVDNHTLLREQLAALLEAAPDLQVCAAVGDGTTAPTLITQHQPDLVILGLSLKNDHVLDLLKALKESSPQLPVLVLSLQDEARYAERALLAGANGYITKEEATADVLTAVRTVLAGKPYVSRQMAGQLQERSANARAADRQSAGSPAKPLRAAPAWMALLLAGLFAGGQPLCAAALPGLIGWWPGQGTALDSAGTNHGTVFGGATATDRGKVGLGFSFDGTSGFVQIPNAPELNPPTLTIEAWVLFTALDSAGSGGSPAGQQYIVFKQNSRSSSFEGFYLGKTRSATGDVFSFVVASAGGQETALQSATLIATSTWYHVAGVRGSDYVQLYVNGQLESQASVSFPQDYGETPLFLGSSGQPYWDHKFAGILDEACLYNRALSGAEIAGIYSARATPAWGDITFFIGSDLHYGYGSCAATCGATVDHMNALPGQNFPAAAGGGAVSEPRGVLLLGDLTENGYATEWMAFTNDWGLNGEQRLSCPVYECFGNHDACCREFVPAGIKARNPLRRGVTNVSTNGYHYSWDWDNVHFVCLNVYPGIGADNVFARNSLPFLMEDLAKNVGSSGRPVILYQHFGFDEFSVNWWSDQERTNYWAAIQNYNIVAILAGHNHLVDYIPWGGFDTFNDGTISKPLTPPFTDFMVVHLTATNLTLAQRNFDGTWGNVFNRPISTNSQPRVVGDPASATAIVGSTASLAVQAIGPQLRYQWFYNNTNPIVGATNGVLMLPELRLAQSGFYTASVTNDYGAVISHAARIDVSAPIYVTPAPLMRLQGPLGTSVSLEYRDALAQGFWQPLGTVTLTNRTQPYVDLAAATKRQRFYRIVSATGTMTMGQVPAVTVYGDPGSTLRLDYSDSPDPATDWSPLATIVLTGTSQVYLDASAPNLGRRYRAVATP
jgi:DNA-binding NarL/FixJ family response regulator